MQSGEAPRRPWKFGWLSVTSSLALVAASLLLVGPGVGAELATLDVRWFGPALGLYLAQLALLGLRWSLIASTLGLDLGFGRATGEYAVSILVNQVLPSGVAGDALRVVRHARVLPDKNWRAAFEALAIDRASGQMALVFVALVTAPVGVIERVVDWKTLLLGAAGGLVGGTLIALVLARFAIGRRVLGAAARFLGRSLRVLIRPRSAIVHLPISIAFVLTTLLGFYVAARALSVDVGVAQLLWLGPWILLAASVPASVGGWGLREGASALLFAAAGLRASTGVAISVVYGFFSLLVAITGFVGWLALELAVRRR